MFPGSVRLWLIVGALYSAALPLGVLLWWRRTRRARLLPFFAGAVVFIVCALVLEPLVHAACLLPDHALARALNGNPWLYMLYAGLTAGLFEETGRYAAFRRFIGKRRYPGRDTAVTCGIGHAGAESVLTLGMTYALYLTLIPYLNAGNEAAALTLPGVSGASLSAAREVLLQLGPGMVLTAMLERTSAMLLHISLSCFVFLAARDRSKRSFFPLAIALHAIADMPAALWRRGLLAAGPAELFILLLSLFALLSARKCYLERMDP